MLVHAGLIGFHIPNLYSLHSWVGICAVLIGSLVWLPCSPLWFHSSTLKPVRIWMGKAMLILSLASCISGINEKRLLTRQNHTQTGNPYNSLPVEAKFANSLGILIVAFGLVIFGILSENRWQRPETDSERAHVSIDAITVIINQCHQMRSFWFELT
uniref:Lysosomal membrane ascorbate-dependent ferrireductase CYB561A3 n=1 Tax=Sander lucioperca TaxID=283035 RepID=A0A8C9X5G6_SANLU